MNSSLLEMACSSLVWLPDLAGLGTLNAKAVWALRTDIRCMLLLLPEDDKGDPLFEADATGEGATKLEPGLPGVDGSCHDTAAIATHNNVPQRNHPMSNSTTRASPNLWITTQNEL